MDTTNLSTETRTTNLKLLKILWRTLAAAIRLYLLFAAKSIFTLIFSHHKGTGYKLLKFFSVKLYGSFFVTFTRDVNYDGVLVVEETPSKLAETIFTKSEVLILPNFLPQNYIFSYTVKVTPMRNNDFIIVSLFRTSVVFCFLLRLGVPCNLLLFFPVSSIACQYSL